VTCGLHYCEDIVSMKLFLAIRELKKLSQFRYKIVITAGVEVKCTFKAQKKRSE